MVYLCRIFIGFHTSQVGVSRWISFINSMTGDSMMLGLAEVAHNCSPLGPWQVP